jgi:hypothetical protein
MRRISHARYSKKKIPIVQVFLDHSFDNNFLTNANLVLSPSKFKVLNPLLGIFSDVDHVTTIFFAMRGKQAI